MTNDEKAQSEAASWREWQTAWGNTESGAHAHGWENGYQAGYQAAGECPSPDGHICANQPLHAQAKIIKQRMDIERLRAVLERIAHLDESDESERDAADIAYEALAGLTSESPK